jgi:D-3-phosphoglycerate dehydrogenase
MSPQFSFPKDKMKILLLEGIHEVAAETFAEAGYTAEIQASAMTEDELIEHIPGVHFIGIRSKTHLTAPVFEAATSLLGVGCFCIGTNQVNLEAAAQNGVPVFNAPFSNTRSVAELAMAEIVMLSRRTFERSSQLHQGVWQKSAVGSREVRQKTLGIIGYGHIGPQVGLLAEAFGMNVVYFDIMKKLALGNASPVGTLKELLEQADFVTLHVPETPETKDMFGAREIGLMKKGSFLLNLSRGSVVDIDALKSALESGQLAGASVDVYPKEPKSNDEEFESPLRGVPNVILTPHIGGSTLEAQKNIGIEVVESLIRYSDTGATSGAVNFPEVELPVLRDSHRVMNIHRNEPGVLRDINKIVADTGANIRSQYLSTNSEVGYLIMDVDPSLSREVKREIDQLSSNIRTRLLF